MEKNVNRTIKAIIMNGISVIINYFMTMWLTHFLTENIGAEAYGFVSVARNFSSYAALASVALNSYAARYITISSYQGDIPKANQFLSSVVITNLIISSLMMLLSAILVVHLEHVLVIPVELVFDVKWLFAFIFLHFFITSNTTGFSLAPIVKNRMDLYGIIKSLSYIIEAICLLVLLNACSSRVFFVGVGMSIAAAVVFSIHYICTRRLTPELKVRTSHFSWSAVKELVTNGIWNTVNSLGNILNSGLDLLMSNVLLSALEMGQLAIVKSVSAIFHTLFSTIFQPFQPLLLKAHATKNVEQVVNTTKVAMKVSGMFSNILFAGLVAVGEVYYSLLVPSQDIGFLQTLTIATIIGEVIVGAVYPIYYTYTLTLKNRIPCFVTLISGFINIGLSYVICSYTDWGVVGIVGKTTVISWIINFVFNPIYAAKCLGLKETTFYDVIVRHIVACVAMTVLFRCVTLIVMPTTWLQLVFSALGLAMLGVVVSCVIVLEKGELEQIKKIVHRK